MEHLRVKDLTIPISEYATVPVGTSLLDAMLTLEQAQEAYTISKYQHRAILVLDENENVVGKIGQLRVLMAVETHSHREGEIEELKDFGFSADYISQIRESYRLQSPILNKESLQLSASKKVEEFMQTPSPGEFVSEDSSLDVAIHKLVSGTHLSLLVTRGDNIIGVLRIADVFAAVFHEMRAEGVASNF